MTPERLMWVARSMGHFRQSPKAAPHAVVEHPRADKARSLIESLLAQLGGRRLAPQPVRVRRIH
jgi:hypothetical protein